MERSAEKRTQKENLERFSPGLVLQSYPGLTAFPVLQASKAFELATEELVRLGNRGPYTIYDPCCGGGYLATVLGLRFRNSIKKIICSDVDKEALALAERNLSLLSTAGLDKRVAKLEEMVESFGKASHKSGIIYAKQIRSEIERAKKEIPTSCFVHNLLSEDAFPDETKEADIIFADMPYGHKSDWKDATGAKIEKPADYAITKLKQVGKEMAVFVVATAKKSNCSEVGFRRVKHFKFGICRTVVLSRLADL